MYSSSGADFSGDLLHRYRLYRAWGPGKRCVFVMLNPSTADESKNDPTVTRCIGFARDWGYDGVDVVNLFAWRATNPRELYVVHDPVGPGNDDAVITAARAASRVVVAWGNHGGLHNRSHQVLDLLRPVCVPMAFSATKQDQPRHPLYVARIAGLIRWDCR